MKTVLAISSQVVHGHIGLGAIQPALMALGHEVWALPSLLLSNHPGYHYGAGQTMAPLALEEMADALEANGWLGQVDAILSGYLPSAEHVELVWRLVRRLKAERPVLYLCDPVLGDDPKGLYIDQEAAEGIRDTLVPIADIVTPNRFELAWLSGETAGTVREARVAAGRIGGDTLVAATSIQSGPGMIANLAVAGEAAWISQTPELLNVPHGTGDLLAGLLLGHVLAEDELTAERFGDLVGRATAGVRTILDASANKGALNMTAINAAAGAVQPATELP